MFRRPAERFLTAESTQRRLRKLFSHSFEEVGPSTSTAFNDVIVRPRSIINYIMILGSVMSLE